MTPRVDLCWLGRSPAPTWLLGEVHCAADDPLSVQSNFMPRLTDTPATHWLLWDGALGAPPTDRVRALAEGGIGLWHAGLVLGQARRPRILDFIAPTWMLNRDPAPDIEAGSWRLSLRACLARVDVLRWSGGLAPGYRTLDAAALELGHRCLMHGIVVRHTPALVHERSGRTERELPLEDEFRFARHRFAGQWSDWAAMRAVLTGLASSGDILRAWHATRRVQRTRPVGAYGVPEHLAEHGESGAPSVTVLIPTLDRYPYLRRVLDQLRHQSVRPLEVIVVDQTPPARFDAGIAREFTDLPVRVLRVDPPGQCRSRNAGLLEARGALVLFLDDDDEVSPDLIERHLRNIDVAGQDVSSGVALEPGSATLPAEFRQRRVSDVFPTNNTMARLSALARSGLFDLAYDRGARADGDLGMRVYLSGASMVLDPEITVLHHHAPRGGLRTHGARVTRYADSRRHIASRQLPEVTELYLAYRYFGPRQVRELLWQAALGTMSLHGSPVRRAAKILVGAALLPLTWRELKRRDADARAMLASYPQIPALARTPAAAGAR